jgi:hypothetical protein
MDDWMLEINRICEKSPQDLNDMEIAFLKARKVYLNGFQLQRFESVLGEVKSKPPETVLKNKKT